MLKSKLVEGKNTSAYNYLEKSLVPSIIEMETNGIMLNTKYLQSLSSEFEKKNKHPRENNFQIIWS